MEALRRFHTSSISLSSASPSSLSYNSSSSPSSSRLIHLRSHLIVNSLPVRDRGSLKSPWSRRKRKHVLTPQQWKRLFTPEGKLCDGGDRLLKKVRNGGVDPSIRSEVWPFLLGVYELNSSEDERNAVRKLNRKEYKKLARRCQCLSQTVICDDKSSITCTNSVVEDEVNIGHALSSTGDKNECEITQVKTESFDSESSSEESSLQIGAQTVEDFTTWQRIIRLDAVRANAEWVIYAPTQQATVSEEKARKLAGAVGLKDYDHLEACMIHHAARLVAVLEAYAIYDPDIGYCQGMSDLLSPIVSVMEEDDAAFWCFVGFMKKARHNFRLDEVGIRRQLSIVSKIIKFKDPHLYRHLEKLQAEDCFFVYRMVLVLFRRELNFEQTLCLWEVMWADQTAIRAGFGKSVWARIRPRAPPTDDLLLYAIAACVLRRRKTIIERYSSMEDILRECNNMAGNLDVWKLLDDAHDLVVSFNDKIS